MPCFGLHPWFIEKAGAGWLPLLEKFLTGAPSCVGEIGLDKAADPDLRRQEAALRAQLRLAVRLARPVIIHCVRAWGALVDILKEERPPAFMVHAYGGPAEITAELARLGGYFSFGGDLTAPGRARMRKALLAAPPDRLLFETEAPSPAELTEVLGQAAALLGMFPGVLGEMSWNNARSFLGEIFPEL
jgi:TatD DNase family protein